MGAGDSREARLADAAAAFVGGALAPLLSRLKGDAVLEARAFWGDEPWAVPGVRGFASAVVARGGADGARFAQAPLFSGIPELPQDGKVHLLKAVVASSGDAWLRTIELDGGATSVSDSRFAALDAQDAPGMVPPAQDARARALERLRSREAWLTSTEACPADLMPATMPDFAYSSGACRGGRLLECLALCEKRAASFCYAAAQEVLQAKEDPGGAQALLLRSCELGFASGCTNAAAGRLGQTSEMDGCSERNSSEPASGHQIPGHARCTARPSCAREPPREMPSARAPRWTRPAGVTRTTPRAEPRTRSVRTSRTRSEPEVVDWEDSRRFDRSPRGEGGGGELAPSPAWRRERRPARPGVGPQVLDEAVSSSLLEAQRAPRRRSGDSR